MNEKLREQLQTRSLTDLKEMAKAQGLRSTGLRKAELVERLCERAAEEAGKQKPKGRKTREKAAANPDRERKEAVQQQEEVRQTVQPMQQEMQQEIRQPELQRFTQQPAVQRFVQQPMQQPQQPMMQNGMVAEPQKRWPQAAGRPYRENNSVYDGRSGRQVPEAQQKQEYHTPARPQKRVSYGQQRDAQNRNVQSGRAYQPIDRAADRRERAQEYYRSITPLEPQGNGYPMEQRAADQGQEYQMRSMEAMQPAEYAPRMEAQGGNANYGGEPSELSILDSGIAASGILEVMTEGNFGFLRCENYLSGDNDVYVAPSQIRKFNLRTGDLVEGVLRIRSATERFAALLYVTAINGTPVSECCKRRNFEDLTPVFPNHRIRLENGDRASIPLRVMDLLAPLGMGQRGMIVSPPKAGKTTLLKQVAKAVLASEPKMHLLILLIDERPEEVTDIREEVTGENVEVIYSTFDEQPERHKRISEMVIERAKRLVESGRDVMILLDSITRLARAYNLVVSPSGRTLSGGLDPAALHMPKRFFGAARNLREGGSLTILATALIDTGSRMDDVIYEEFKGTGNMELVLDRRLSERRIFPAIDILKSGTRRDDLLLDSEEQEAVSIIRKATTMQKPEEVVEKILERFSRTKNNQEVTEYVRKMMKC